MGLYLTSTSAVLEKCKLNRVKVSDINIPPTQGEVYICLTAPYNSFLVITDQREADRVTKRNDGWTPKAVYIGYINEIAPFCPGGSKHMRYGQVVAEG